ncbi:rod shape-determining protein RodA [Mahella australiensis]|uniref:Peptidoglycan glycosyltransferase RodA n=1 Tax=Mahella australiensis (strain DSM 15567 / CIP 107919 / 50-1 BON) TaxID=697281 RepID=F4A2N2_MAHA5|nr:rod shape-determining protein RodA [Mahella australiensis]AEE96212.1 rod shape-determining protein RodA [Mahella australiensis 50-1 BON]
MVNKRFIKYIDYSLILAVTAIVFVGLFAISSATGAYYSGDYSTARMQLMWFIAGFIAMIIVISVDYKTIGNMAVYIYLFCLLMLVIVLLFGKEVNGSKSWLGVGGLGGQPSEFAKLGVVIMVAKVMSSYEDGIKNLKQFITVLIYIGIPLVLILKQPDLGTALVFIAIALGMFIIGGIDYKFMLTLIGAGAAAVPLAWKYVLEDYQKDRLLIFLDPYSDPMGNGFNVIQSMIAIGSGQITGRGLYHGSQSQFNFVPEQYTDFIFSVVGEELGFIVCASLIALYAYIIFKSIRISLRSKDKFGMLMVIGIISMLGFQIFENIGMTMGIMPITGIPLPFMSYGGSSLFTNMIALGLILNVGMRQHKIKF